MSAEKYQLLPASPPEQFEALKAPSDRRPAGMKEETMPTIDVSQVGHCPQCGKAEGPIYISSSLWFYCRDHKVKWLAGWDLSAADTPTAEQKRRYDEIGFDEFEYIGPDSEGYRRFQQRQG